MVLDIAFYCSSALILFFWLKGIEAKTKSITLPTPNDVIALGYERALEVLSEAKAFFFLLIFSAVIVLLALIFLASIMKAIIWAKTTNTKLSFSLISRFLVLNLIWTTFWTAIFLFILIFVKPELVQMLIIIAIILWIYLTNTLYSIFMKEQKFNSVISTIKLNATKIHLFLLPYALIFLTLFVIASLGRLTRLDALSFFVTTKLADFVGLDYSFGLTKNLTILIIALLSIFVNPLFLLSAALIRYYTSNLVLEIEKR